MSTTISRTRTLIECALMVAVGTVLAQIKILDMPYGGSLTLFSMLPFVLVSFRHGVKWGLLCGLANSLLQMLIGGLYPPPSGTLIAFAGMILLDYILAFSVLGLACFFAKPVKNKMIAIAFGTATVCFLRFVCSFLSGTIIWASFSNAVELSNAALGSFLYNGAYMLPEMILTTIAALLLYKSAPSVFANTNNY